MTNYHTGIVNTESAVIASGASLSGAIDLRGTHVTNKGLRLFGIVMPAAWTAANLTFQASFDGGTTYVNMYDYNGLEVVATASTSRLIVLDPVVFASIPLLKIRSGTAASAVNQGGDRTLTLVLRSI